MNTYTLDQAQKEIRDRIAVLVQQMLLETKYNQSQLARDMNLHRQQLQAVCAAKNNISMAFLIRICYELGYDLTLDVRKKHDY